MLLANAGLSRTQVLRDGGFCGVPRTERTPTAAEDHRHHDLCQEPRQEISQRPKAQESEIAAGVAISVPRRVCTKFCEEKILQEQHHGCGMAADKPVSAWRCWNAASTAASVQCFHSLLGACWVPFDVTRPDGRKGDDVERELAAVKLQAAFRRYMFRKRTLPQDCTAPELAVCLAHMLKYRRAARQERWKSAREPVKRARLLKRAFVFMFSVATVLLFVATCAMVLILYVQTNVYLTYVWGRCMDTEVREQARLEGRECHDPEYIHGVWGWFAEVSSDVSLAVIFDVCLGEVCKLLARFLATLQDYDFLYDQRYAVVMLSLVIEALSKVGMFAVVGFAYLPQWHPHALQPLAAAGACPGLPDYELCRAVFHCDVDEHPDCCEGALLCVARHFDFDHRRWLFERAAKGPFYVAPFVRMLITVVLPYVVGWLEIGVEADLRRKVTKYEAMQQAPITTRAGPKRGCLRCVRGCARRLVRILALIFHVDPQNVGGMRYILRGWPFGPPNLEPDRCHGSPEEAEQLLEGALDQVARRSFEPFDELVELKMNFLFVSFLAPVMPFGVIPTLAARLLELRSKSLKMFFVRRRCWPDEARLLHATQRTFAHIVAHAAVVWHLGLILVVYNSKVAHWGALKTLVVWIVSAAAVTALLHSMSRLLSCICGNKASIAG